MPIAIVGIVFGSFLLLMKMILEHKRQNAALPTAQDGNSMKFSELEQHILATVNQAIEPLVARIDELESAQLLASSERLLIGETPDKTKESELSRSTDRS